MSHALRSAVLLLGFAHAALSPLPAAAQEYPAREIRSICNFAAGSGAESMAALIKAETENWGKYVRLAKIEPQ
ncbi:MAG: hypothetical protein E6H51_00240 [Betaproteobacteria bacterium]|nr:MAG: hypothetical protein E6H70_11290 [Betaproteobacteria bacterium]TMH80793.1 MAG: hypothetical protein E6H51_00240 [Betaproteobacteria bacterium]